MAASGLRGGFTTGACAAAAAGAATALLCGRPAPAAIELAFPDGSRDVIPIAETYLNEKGAVAVVIKDAGDDPDVTHGMRVEVEVAWAPGDEVLFAAGEGIGMVTLPGLSVIPGEPAINPGPRRMIREAVRAVTPRGVRVTIAIPGGRELAERTFNPRLGVTGGLSILGTSGRVRPFSTEAMLESFKAGLDVAVACGVTAPVFVPGHIGERAARRWLKVGERQVIEVGNAWGFMLAQARHHPLERLLALGHPGKLAKLWLGQWDTHSAVSSGAPEAVSKLAREVLGRELPESTTVEGIFNALAEDERRRVADALAERIRKAIEEFLITGSADALVRSSSLGTRTASSANSAHSDPPSVQADEPSAIPGFNPQSPIVSVALIAMNGDWLGEAGDLEAWR